uniref:C2H2-type domain-containing protein n=1 Tax=Capra hircus TaxID=9925 RepID=A0A8C2SNB5_CAPHI
MDVDSTISSGRSTPAMMNGQGSTTSSSKNIAYNCCWDQCQACFTSSPDLADHIRSIHVDGQRGGCVVGGCNASFASQGGLARHVPTHFSQQNSSKVSSQPKAKEESPSKAGMNKRRKLKNKRRRSLRKYSVHTERQCVSDGLVFNLRLSCKFSFYHSSTLLICYC